MNVQTKCRYNLGILGVLFLVVMFADSAFGEALVKVHKDKITVSAIHEQGMVFVEGSPGAIATTSKLTSLVVRNLSADTKILVQAMDDGSLRGEIQGEPGDRIRVEARNQEGKRSIGTFTAKAIATSTTPYAGWQTIKEAPQPTLPNQPGMPGTPSPRKAGARNLAVMVMVIDMGKGELIATERIVGVPRLNTPDEALYQHTAQKIIHKCIDAIRSELKPTVGHVGYEKPLRPRYELTPVEEKQLNEAPEQSPKENANPSVIETEGNTKTIEPEPK